MKYIVMVLIVIGCSTGQKEVSENYSTVIIENCEYITYANSYRSANNYSFTITHKGNCKNPIHQCDK